MQRRSFLSGILVAATAPAIVKAGSLMPIWVPSQKITLDSEGAFRHGTYTNIDKFVEMQIRHIGKCIGVPYEQLIADMPTTEIQYSNARIAFPSSFYTPLSRPLDVRFP